MCMHRTLRLAGREPMLRRPSSLTGVADWKYSMKRGSLRTTSRYESHDICSGVKPPDAHSSPP